MSEQTAGEIDREVKAIIDKGFKLATDSLKKNQSFISEAAKELLASETLSEKDIARLWEKFGRINPQLIPAGKEPDQATT